MRRTGWRLMLGAATAAALALCGCGSDQGAGAGSLQSALAGAGPGLRALHSKVSSEIVAPGTADARLARRAYALTLLAEQEAGTIAGLNAPSAYNTRVRDLRSALLSLARDLNAVSTDAGRRDGPSTAAAVRAADADSTDANSVARALQQALRRAG